jgi:hypothetical protein
MIEVDVQDGHDCGELAAPLALGVRRSEGKSRFDIGSPQVWLWRALMAGMAAGLRKAETMIDYTSCVPIVLREAPKMFKLRPVEVTTNDNVRIAHP